MNKKPDTPLRSATGYIVMRDAAGARVVADGLRYTNEYRVGAQTVILQWRNGTPVPVYPPGLAVMPHLWPKR